MTCCDTSDKKVATDPRTTSETSCQTQDTDSSQHLTKEVTESTKDMTKEKDIAIKKESCSQSSIPRGSAQRVPMSVPLSKVLAGLNVSASLSNGLI